MDLSIIFDLESRFDDLLSEMNENIFDVDNFQSLLVDTYNLFSEFKDNDSIPKETLMVFKSIVQFANYNTYLSDELDACELVAEALIEFISNAYSNYQEPENDRILFVDITYSCVHFNVDEFNLSKVLDINK